MQSTSLRSSGRSRTATTGLPSNKRSSMGTATIHRRHSPFRRSLFIRDSCSSFLEPLITRFSAFGTRKLRVYPLNSSTTTDITLEKGPPDTEGFPRERERETKASNAVIVRKMERARNGGNERGVDRARMMIVRMHL